MKFTTKVIAIIGAARLSLASASSGAQGGSNCPLFTQVECKLNNGDPCQSLTGLPYDDCGVHTLNWNYKFCNENSEGRKISIISARSGAKNDQVPVADFVYDTSDMPGGCRTPPIVVKKVDTCQTRAIAAELKIQGKLIGDDGLPMEEQINYCYGYAFQRVKLRAKPPQATNGPPAIKLNIKCLYEESATSGFNKDCSTLSNVTPPNGQCTRPVIFRHTITNDGGKSRVQALIDESNDNLLGNGNSIYLSEASEWVFDKEEVLDLCEQAGQTINRKAVAIAAADPAVDGTARIAQASAQTTVILP